MTLQDDVGFVAALFGPSMVVSSKAHRFDSNGFKNGSEQTTPGSQLVVFPIVIRSKKVGFANFEKDDEQQQQCRKQVVCFRAHPNCVRHRLYVLRVSFWLLKELRAIWWARIVDVDSTFHLYL